MAKGITIVVHGVEIPYGTYVKNGTKEVAAKTVQPHQKLFAHECLDESVPLACASGVIRFGRVRTHTNGFELQKYLAHRAQPVFGAKRGLLLYRHQRRIDSTWQRFTILFPLDTFYRDGRRYWFALIFDGSEKRWVAQAIDLSWEFSTPTVIATV